MCLCFKYTYDILICSFVVHTVQFLTCAFLQQAFNNLNVTIMVVVNLFKMMVWFVGNCHRWRSWPSADCLVLGPSFGSSCTDGQVSPGFWINGWVNSLSQPWILQLFAGSFVDQSHDNSWILLAGSVCDTSRNKQGDVLDLLVPPVLVYTNLFPITIEWKLVTRQHM